MAYLKILLHEWIELEEAAMDAAQSGRVSLWCFNNLHHPLGKAAGRQRLPHMRCLKHCDAFSRQWLPLDQIWYTPRRSFSSAATLGGHTLECDSEALQKCLSA